MPKGMSVLFLSAIAQLHTDSEQPLCLPITMLNKQINTLHEKKAINVSNGQKVGEDLSPFNLQQIIN